MTNELPVMILQPPATADAGGGAMAQYRAGRVLAADGRAIRRACPEKATRLQRTAADDA